MSASIRKLRVLPQFREPGLIQGAAVGKESETPNPDSMTRNNLPREEGSRCANTDSGSHFRSCQRDAVQSFAITASQLVFLTTGEPKPVAWYPSSREICRPAVCIKGASCLNRVTAMRTTGAVMLRLAFTAPE